MLQYTLWGVHKHGLGAASILHSVVQSLERDLQSRVQELQRQLLSRNQVRDSVIYNKVLMVNSLIRRMQISSQVCKSYTPVTRYGII